MKNSIFWLFVLLFPCGGVRAAEVGVAARQEVGRTLTRIVAREVDGGYVKVQGVKASRGRVRIYASIGLSYYPFREENVRALRDSVRAALPREFSKARIELYTDGREVAELIPMAFREPAQLARELKKRRIVPFTNRSERPLVEPLDRPAKPSRGLAGRHIALWQSHGRYFDQKENLWRWQRSQLWQTCEDLYTQSYVVPYLVPMLENAGANVLLPRERDVQKHEVTADNDAPGQYREEGGGWMVGGSGFAHRQQVYRTGENPFRHGTTRLARTVTQGEPSRAVWSATIPERGEYAVYICYESTPESADDALYTVRHLGGESRFAVNQTLGGGTWIYLGRFLLDEGEQEVVTLSNRSRRAGRIVSADAVKIGGGYGNVARTVCDSLRKPGLEYTEETSGYPRFCEGARYWLQWAGFDEKVYTPKKGKDDYKDDYMSRAHWVNALAGGSERLPDSAGLRIPVDMALAFHSDAGVRDGDGIVGTLGIFFTRDQKGRFDGGADRYRSRDLTDIVQTQIVEDIRRTWEPDWKRRGLWNRSYYEARVPGVPTMLLELLSHQNFADMRYGSDPRFKFVVSRAVYKGILRYLSSQYGVPYSVQPLPVEQMAVEFTESGNTVISWEPVADSLETSAVPDGFVVYTRVDDGGFDNGQYVDKPYFMTEQEPGRIYSYRVTAINAGGESFPGETLSACRMPDAKGCVMIVNGFDRISAPHSMRRDSTAGFYMGIDGGVPDRHDLSFVGEQRVYDLSMARCDNDSRALGACYNDYETEVVGGNTFDYPSLHGRSVAAAGYSFCSASVRAVEEGAIPLNGYEAVDLILGKQRASRIGRGLVGDPRFRTFPPALQEKLEEYLEQGGALYVSGSYVATDLWTGDGATAAGRAFAERVLHYTYDGGQAARRGRVRVVTSHAGFAREEYRFNNEFTPFRYKVEAPDALRPAGGAFAVMRYVENNRAAGVAREGDGRTFVMGFPFEAILSQNQRDRLMRDVLEFLSGNKNDKQE
ncbi:xanthan lyase [Alistipes sp.]|uniref:golvesin C-terminal-like domain-containing protein n=1 Tax=Alistipes sp. TaxID=1872444 RepID=UPI003AF0F2D8